jgi:hypothetical protein
VDHDVVASARAVSIPVSEAELAQARPIDGGRFIAWLLRSGALMSGSLFAASLVLELLPQNYSASVAMDGLRKAGASVLLATPVVRLVVAGGLLGVRGEWRYAVFAGGILALLAAAVGAGLAA